MKNIFLSFLLITCVLSACKTEMPSDATEVVATNLDNLSHDMDATPVITDVMARIEDHSSLIIPRGKYHFYPDYATGRYLVISNNDNGYCQVLFNLSNKKNITIDGQGVEFIFHGHMVPFNIENSENITIRNLSIDWDHTFHSEATVLANDPGNETFDHAIIEGFSVDSLVFRGNTVRQTNTFEPIWPGKAALNFSFSENIEVSGNKFEFLDDYEILHLNEASEDEVVMKNNN